MTSHFALSTGKEIGDALWKHREHHIHIMRTVCVMCKIVLRLNDLHEGYVYLHKHTLIQREKGCPSRAESAPGTSMTCSGRHEAIWA